jgi:hypothetical protein
MKKKILFGLIIFMVMFFTIKENIYAYNINAMILATTSNDCDVLAPIRDLLNQAFYYIKFAVPILLIVFGTVDFSQAVIAGDDKGVQQALNRFIKRIIAGIAIFFLPYVVNLLLSLAGDLFGSGTCGIG